MSNILDYIAWRGDILFSERGLNEVDGLVFSELAYMTMEDIVPGLEAFSDPFSHREDRSVTIADIFPLYMNADKKRPVFQEVIPLLEACAESRRFMNIPVFGFVNMVDREISTQFAAVCFLVEDTVYVAFRGTDETITGWREDFDAFYIEATPAQRMAVDYLNSIGEKTECPLVVGGHSKGGNLAVFASAFCSDEVRERILGIYSNDGPGFNDSIIERAEYKNIIGRVTSIIPDSSFVGILLTTKSEKRIIKSDAQSGFSQHNPFTWQIDRDHFITADAQSSQSVFLDEALKSWLASLNNEEKKIFITTFFDLLEASGATTMTEIADNKLSALSAFFKAGIGLPSEKQKVIWTALKNFANAARLQRKAGKASENDEQLPSATT